MRAEMVSEAQIDDRGYLERGYSVVKMKIGGASLEEDRQRIEAVGDDVTEAVAHVELKHDVRVRTKHRRELDAGHATA